MLLIRVRSRYYNFINSSQRLQLTEPLIFSDVVISVSSSHSLLIFSFAIKSYFPICLIYGKIFEQKSFSRKFSGSKPHVLCVSAYIPPDFPALKSRTRKLPVPAINTSLPKSFQVIFLLDFRFFYVSPISPEFGNLDLPRSDSCLIRVRILVDLDFRFGFSRDRWSFRSGF